MVVLITGQGAPLDFLDSKLIIMKNLPGYLRSFKTLSIYSFGQCETLGTLLKLVCYKYI